MMIYDYANINKVNCTIEDRINFFEKYHIPYVVYEHTKPDGNKVRMVVRTDMPQGKKLVGKKAFSQLYK